ncbi:tetratricopeptide repeat-containing protein [Novosphingobium sp. Rr 2-17]|nr:tetratricopeptide repeat-containing protein [Novosphingobium sp. Rr 2-17]
MLNMTRDPIEAAAALLASRPDLAERQARDLIARLPGDPRPQLIFASALRRTGKAAAALPLLTELSRRFPRAARTRYELGLCLALVGRAAQGLAQLGDAVRLDPQMPEAWNALAETAFALGDAATETAARAVLARMACADPQVGRAAEMVVRGDHASAEPLLRRHLLAQPDDADACRLLAACYVAVRAFDNAETLLRHALAITCATEPLADVIRFDLACALFARQQAEKALVELAPLLGAAPRNPAYRNLKAGCLALLGDDVGAEALHAELAAEFPGNPRIAINHGHALRTAGARDEAIATYRRALALRPQTGEAWWSLANLKVSTLTAGDEAQMRDVLRGPLADVDRMHLEYALGRRREEAGDPGQAFAHYAAGAAIVRHSLDTRPDYEAEANAAAALFTPAFFKERADWGVMDEAPIFVVGLPRSGSTLIEQILASHPAIEGTMELPYIPSIAGQAAQADGGLAGASPTQVRAWGEEYLSQVRLHRRLGRARFIDKMPNNFRHIGLIRLILPRARIVDVRRHPMAACFSAFKQLFAEGQAFSYDLNDLARYYRHYLAIIRHFDRVAPGAVYSVRYEDVVEDTETQVRALLDAVGVPFEPACLRFFENDRAVRTVSSEQVRQPIYRSGLDHWRAFAPFLEPLAAGLGGALEDWRT